MARRHLAIFLRGAAEKILAGEKLVEIRLSQSRIVPYGAVSKGDEIYLKDAGGLILGKIEVENVLYYDNLTKEIIGNIRREYGTLSKMSDIFFAEKAKASFATIIFLKKPQRFLAPINYKKHDRRGWLIMEEN